MFYLDLSLDRKVTLLLQENIRHPFIVKMDYAFQSDSKLFFVLEYCPGGELFFYLSQIGRFKEDAARFYASNILLSLHHLHSQDILYRDLKPENVLVAADGYVKIADFGLSKENIQGHSDAKSICGTAEYLAPEVVTRRGHGQSVDFWSLGVIVYEMMYGVTPFFAETNRDIFKRILQGDVEFPTVNLSDSSSTSRVEDGAEDGVEDGVESCCDLILRLLDQAPMTRLGALLDG